MSVLNSHPSFNVEEDLKSQSSAAAPIAAERRRKLRDYTEFGATRGCILRTRRPINSARAEAPAPRSLRREEGVASASCGLLHKFGQQSACQGGMLSSGPVQSRRRHRFSCRPGPARPGDACVFDRSQYQSVHRASALRAARLQGLHQ